MCNLDIKFIKLNNFVIKIGIFYYIIIKRCYFIVESVTSWCVFTKIMFK